MIPLFSSMVIHFMLAI